MEKTTSRNCIRTSEKYFLFSPIDLFTHLTIFPENTMSFGAKLNSMLRLSILIFFVLLIMEYRYAWIFLIASTIINIVYYYLYYKEYE